MKIKLECVFFIIQTCSVSVSAQTSIPSKISSDSPTSIPIEIPSSTPSKLPTLGPTNIPTISPTTTPSELPSLLPTSSPSLVRSDVPSLIPSTVPTTTPSTTPSTSVSPSSSPSTSQVPTVSFVPTLSLLPTAIPTSTPSQSPTIECYNDWFNLMTDVEDSNGSEKFIVCPNTVLYPQDIDFNGTIYNEIFFYGENIELYCGEDGNFSNNCKFYGGKSHMYFHKNWNVTGTIISGFHFIGATDTSVSIWSSASDSGYVSSVIFRECRWSSNYGDAYFGIVSVWRASAVFESCSFDDNTSPTGTGIYAEDAIISVEGSYFQNNTGNGWAIEGGEDAIVSVSDSCFYFNSGPVYMYKNSTLEYQSDNYGYGSLDTYFSCDGIYFQTNKSCVDFGTSSCSQQLLDFPSPSVSPVIDDTTTSPTKKLEPTLSSSYKPSYHPREGCYTSWDRLRDDVSNSDGNEVFIVCPGVKLEASKIFIDGTSYTDIWIQVSGIEILCGEDGALVNDCIIEGGESHIFVSGEGLVDVLVSGFTFAGASDTSILGFCDPSSSMKVENCIFVENEGRYGAAIAVWEWKELEDGMTINVTNCTFNRNEGSYGPGVFIEYGKGNIASSYFEEQGGRGWAVEVYDGDISVVDSCFYGNNGPVFVWDGEIVENERNYGFNNTDEEYPQYNCEGIYFKEDSSCNEFSNDICSRYRQPTMAPTRAPLSPPGNTPFENSNSSYGCFNITLSFLIGGIMSILTLL